MIRHMRPLRAGDQFRGAQCPCINADQKGSGDCNLVLGHQVPGEVIVDLLPGQRLVPGHGSIQDLLMVHDVFGDEVEIAVFDHQLLAEAQFHETLISACGSQTLIDTHHRVYCRFRQQLMVEDRDFDFISKNIMHHQQILDA
ncbi:MAG: FCD domain-containing protein, partial [Pseudomonadota bacterium]